METGEIGRALEEGALPGLWTFTLEVMFVVPKEWNEWDLALHRKLKAMATERGESTEGKGLLFAVLQPS